LLEYPFVYLSLLNLASSIVFSLVVRRVAYNFPFLGSGSVDTFLLYALPELEKYVGLG
jgi:hypothetical protein